MLPLFLQPYLWKWLPLPLQLPVQKVKAKSGWAYGTTLLQLWVAHTTWLPTMNWRIYCPFPPTSLSVDISISWCRYVVLFFQHLFWICLYKWVCIISSLTCFHLVLGESLRIITNYLDAEENVVMATSKAVSTELECSKLKKDLIAIMNERNDAN